MNGRWCTAVLALAVLAAPAWAADYRMLTSWDKSNPAVPLLAEGYAKNVAAASKGNINFVLNGPETVPPFEQLQPVTAGAFHMLFTHGIYHYGTTGLSVGLDAVRGTIEERRASGLFEALDKHYQQIGLKVIAVALSAKSGYAFALKAPVSADGDLKGRKVRGTPAYHPVIRMLGGAPVVLPISGGLYLAREGRHRRRRQPGGRFPRRALVRGREISRAAVLRRHAPALLDEPCHLEQVLRRRQEASAR